MTYSSWLIESSAELKGRYELWVICVELSDAW